MKTDFDCSKELEVVLGWITNLNYINSNESTLIDYFVTVKNSAAKPEIEQAKEIYSGLNQEEYVRDSKTLFNFLNQHSQENLMLHSKNPSSFVSSFIESVYASSISHSIDYSKQFVDVYFDQSAFTEDASKKIIHNELRKHQEKLEKSKVKALHIKNNHNITKEKVHQKNENKKKAKAGTEILESFAGNENYDMKAELSPIEHDEDSINKSKTDSIIGNPNQQDSNFNLNRVPIMMHPNFQQQNMFIPRFIPPIYASNMGFNGMFNYPINPNEAALYNWPQNPMLGNPQLMQQMQMNMNMQHPIQFQNNHSRFVETTPQMDPRHPPQIPQPSSKNNSKKNRKKGK